MSFPVLKAVAAVAALVSALPAAAAADTDAARTQWAAQVREQLANAQQYPHAALAKGIEGTVVVRLDVARDGQVLAYEIAGSSGEQVLDRAALKSIAKIGQLPALAGGGESYSFTVPMSFKLAGAPVAHEANTVEAWQNSVRRTVANNLAYTDKMAAEGVEGRVKVRLTLAADGRVLGRELHESSGNETLDAEVLHLAGRISKLPGLPAGEEGASIVLPLTYKLADAR